MVLKEERDGHFIVRLGTMGEQANRDVIYKPNWFYQQLPSILHMAGQQLLIGELYPTHLGYNKRLLDATNVPNAFGVFTEIGTQRIPGEADIHVVARLKLSGEQSSLVQSILQNDPQGWTWQFQMRALIVRERYLPCTNAVTQLQTYKSLIPQVAKVITWDLHHKYD